MKPVFDSIIESIPAPSVDPDGPFRMLVTSIEHGKKVPICAHRRFNHNPDHLRLCSLCPDDYVGRIVTGKVSSGSCAVGDAIKALSMSGQDLSLEGKVTKIMVREGLHRQTLDRACAGDIVSISGLRANVTDTICSPEVTEALDAIPLDPPTISMEFSVNDSPLAGKDGTKLTSTMVKSRLESECENNVTISIKPGRDSDSVEVQGRGELQMGILIEQMRREGFELCVSPPHVLMRKDENGNVLEPVEEVTVDVESSFASTVIDKMQRRGADMVDFNNNLGDRSRLVFHIPSRRLMGYRSEFMVCSLFVCHPYNCIEVNDVFTDRYTWKRCPL